MRPLRAVCAAAALAVAVPLLSLAGTGPVVAQPDSTAGAAELTPTHNPLVALPASGAAYLIRYRSTTVRGEPVTLTGSLLLPRRRPPAGGWPLAVWNHMTTGGADKCAPSTARRGSTALADMTSGDGIVAALLRDGYAVVRPDYEGIGSPGPHPYLIGSSLARSVIGAARAVMAAEPRIGREVVLAGHSEGAVAALFAAAAPRASWGDLRVRAVVGVTPPTRMADIVTGVAKVPVAAGRTTGELVGLAALLVSGATTVDPDFGRLIADGGLSTRANRLMSAVERVCYRDLASPTLFGALAPAELLGPRGGAALARLSAIAGRNDVAHLRLPPGVAVRFDAGVADAVAPAPLVAELAQHYRERGVPVTLALHAGGHAQVPRRPETAPQIVEWLRGRVR